jgi:hypothetical protein
MPKEHLNSLQEEALRTCLDVLKTAFDTVIVAVAVSDRASVMTAGNNQRTQLLADVVQIEVPAQIKMDPHGDRKKAS